MENQVLEGRADFGMETKKELTLRAVWGKQQGKLILCPPRDAITQKMRGVNTFSPEEARLQKRVVTEDTTREIKDGLVINLEDDVDKVDWEWIKECKEVELNLEGAQQSHSALFYVEDLDREVIERVQLDDLRFEAKKLIKDSSDFRKSEVTQLLGRDSKYMRPIDIADFLNDLSSRKPQLVIDTYEDEDYKLKLFLMSLIDAKVIYKDNNGFYKYESVVLGVNKAAAIHWLKDANNQSMVRQFQKILNPIDFNKPSEPNIVKEEKVPDTILDDSPEPPLEEAPVAEAPITENDEFGPFKGTEAWNKLSPQAKGKINKARKNAEK
jgi:hypothetical protein